MPSGIRYIFYLLLAFYSSTLATTVPPANLIPNGGFEQIKDNTPLHWQSFWTRQNNAGRLSLDTTDPHGGKYSTCIHHEGAEDWSLNTDRSLPVRPGDIFELSGWVKIAGPGSTTLGVITYDDKNNVLQWIYGARSAQNTPQWQRISSRFIINRQIASILPRIIGRGRADVWWDDLHLFRQGNLNDLRRGKSPPSLRLENKFLSLQMDTAAAALSVTDKRINHTWRQSPAGENVFILNARRDGAEIHLTWLYPPNGREYRSVIHLETDSPEFTFTVASEESLSAPLQFPSPFLSVPGDYLVVPMNEGISYPVDDASIPPRRLIAYGGHGICMAFWAVTNGRKGHLAIIETPDDAAIHLHRRDKLLCIAPQWDSQKGRFGYTRRLRYVFFDQGGHVAACKRYRRYAQQTGLLKTLAQKRRENPHVDLLIGAVNTWCWDRNALEFVREMKSLGIERILWSHRENPETIRAMNNMKTILTSRYDIYQDLMDPDVLKNHLRRAHADWTQSGWPHDLMLDASGNWRKGWRVKGKDGNMYPCGVLCDRRAPDHARRRVPAELQTHPYRSRFIDTTTASSWRECFHDDHPMTRTDSKFWKMQLLRYMSEDMKLVTGSETGHDAAVPFVHYFEGMLSLGPYRVPDAGRRMIEAWQEIPERVAKFQLGHRYRLPLWELVYHDCVVAQWYWGDYNNKLPALWDKRDLFNILYATPPMFMFNRQIWRENKKRFVQSYKNVCPVARAAGYAEMIDHRFLTSDRAVQQTVFSNGITITVNFGSQPHRLSDGTLIKSMHYHAKGLP